MALLPSPSPLPTPVMFVIGCRPTARSDNENSVWLSQHTAVLLLQYFYKYDYIEKVKRILVKCKLAATDTTLKPPYRDRLSRVYTGKKKKKKATALKHVCKKTPAVTSRVRYKFQYLAALEEVISSAPHPDPDFMSTLTSKDRSRKERKSLKNRVAAPMARNSVRGKSNPTFAFLFTISGASIKFGCLILQESLPPSMFLNIQLLLLYVLELFVAFVGGCFHSRDVGHNIDVA